MATVHQVKSSQEIDYPTSDGRPMAETDIHRQDMVDLIATLKDHYAADPNVYVSGNLLVFYTKGDRHKHLSPDVFVVRGVPNRQRLNYLIWEEGKSPEMIIELTSASTRAEDLDHKFKLYRDKLQVLEYFLFDPQTDYLQPPLQGYRLHQGEYVPIEAIAGRLPSAIMGLHLEQDGDQLRLFDPEGNRWLPTPQEQVAQAEKKSKQAEVARRQDAARAEKELKQAEAARRQDAAQSEEKLQQAEASRRQAEEEVLRLKKEIEALRRGK